MSFLKYILFFLIAIFLYGFSFSYRTIDFSKYKDYLNILKNADLSKVNFKNVKLSSWTCFYFSSWNYFYVKASCFYYKKFPKLSIKEFASLIFPYIEWFENVYDLNSTWFFYQTAKPKFYLNFDTWYIWTWKNKLLLDFILDKLNYFIKIPKLQVAFLNLENYSFFVAWKNLSKRDKWRLQNFNVAIRATDNLVLQPGENFNFNKKVAYLPWYYTKNSDRKYAFYGWVCWVSTMFFRNALINPYLYVTKRYNHNHRYVYFYSSYLYWDDAAVYQFDKILELKNISNKPILFKTKKIWNEIYLVSLIPKRWKWITYVKKEKIWRLKAKVSKTVYNPDWSVWYKQLWISKYFGYDYSRQ